MQGNFQLPTQQPI